MIKIYLQKSLTFLICRKTFLVFLGCGFGMICSSYATDFMGTKPSGSASNLPALSCDTVFKKTDVQSQLERLGYDSSLSKRMLDGAPNIANLAIAQSAGPRKYYRGMMIPITHYNPSRNSIYMTPSKEMALRYSSGGAYDPKLAGTYVRIVFEYTFPNIPNLTRPGGPGNKNATLPTFSIPDERTFISAIGITVETNSIPTSVWFTYDEAFDNEGQLHSDLQKQADERSSLARSPTDP